ncbi:MAG TPA: hypothetical protein DCP90_03130 [Clostridiales bacterium]|nr:MAG: hypothetical protein A2Y22_08120 [Clostridiales bacterium GWD2_32_59]HAN09588.1 hypothetical protein [Clostridiales bacterium]
MLKEFIGATEEEIHDLIIMMKKLNILEDFLHIFSDNKQIELGKIHKGLSFENIKVRDAGTGITEVIDVYEIDGGVYVANFSNSQMIKEINIGVDESLSNGDLHKDQVSKVVTRYKDGEVVIGLEEVGSLMEPCILESTIQTIEVETNQKQVEL